ncbi:MAG: saccharopine dehydrogenase NADP-binding domain-containing protein [Gemmatimonadaceae bacterium]|nr:saccharopine dehydrogenase NADP-binding domain-containing protein [Gemmatimonadaceae bacterium]
MLLLYGANGYTGQLIVAECVRRGLRPILAGRRAKSLAPLAAAHGLEVRVFSLDDVRAIETALAGVRVVLHAAGPFFRTSRPMVQACLAARVHYLDITGEIAVFEACRATHDAAVASGVVLMPGVGFDVVPTDCLAARLAERLPDARLLELAFAGGGGFSRGTLKTMVLGSGEGGAIRQDGRITKVPAGWRTQRIPFRDKPRHAVTIPWGDVSTAHWSTTIPNIHTYLAMPANAVRSMGLLKLISPMLAIPVLRRFVEAQIDARVDGPSAAVRASARMQIWGRVTHGDGRTLEGTAQTPEGYRLTAIASVEAAMRVLDRAPAAGYHTPSTAFGSGFLETLPECDVVIAAGGP